MRKILLYSLITVFLIWLGSCTEVIDVELDSTFTRLVVYGELTTDTTEHVITLTYSADYLTDQIPAGVENASVELSYDDTSFILIPGDPGKYMTRPDFFGIPGKHYNLKIDGVDIDRDGKTEIYEASTYLPAVNPLDSIALKYTSNTFFSGWEIMVYAWDPEGIRNFYSFKSYLNGILQTDTLTELIVQNDDLFDGNYTYGITSQFLDDSKSNEKALPGDTITFEINGITEEYFWFIVEAQTEAFGNIPMFSGPPANIKSNISNGALGFFTAYSIDRKSAIVPAYPEK